jgi:hypothetical protein
VYLSRLPLTLQVLTLLLLMLRITTANNNNSGGATTALDEAARFELREQKIRLDKEFGSMLGKIADRKDALLRGEASLAALDRARRSKEEELRALERKLVVLLEEQQRELEGIRGRQEKRSNINSSSTALAAGGGANGGATVGSGASQQLQLVAAGGGGPSARDKRQAAQLMASTETLMKFGFMSMSMTYFSSLNMIRAMRAVGASDTVLGALAHNTAVRDGGSSSSGSSSSAVAETAANAAVGAQPFRPALKPGESLGQQPLRVAAWSVGDVARWLQTLSLPQVSYCACTLVQ